MASSKTFYILAASLLLLCVSYIALFACIPIDALLYNGYSKHLLFASSLFLLVPAICILCIGDMIYSKFKNREKSIMSNSTLLLTVVIGILFAAGVHLSGEYPQPNNELSAAGYQHVLKISSESEKTRAHSEILNTKGILTIWDLDALLEIHKDDLNLKYEIGEAAIEKQAREKAKSELYSLLVAPKEANKTKTLDQAQDINTQSEREQL